LTAFISYSGDHDRIRKLVQAMRRHGRNTWRDEDSLGTGTRTEDQIRHELSHCDAAMIWIGGNTLASSFVTRIEIPLIFENARDRGMRIVPLFVDVDVQEGIDAVRRATGDEIGGHNGHRFRGAVLFAEDLAHVANAEVGAHLDLRATRGPMRPALRLVTRSDGAPARDTADVNFNWIAEYPADGQLPDIATIHELEEALHASVAHVLRAFGTGPVDLYLKCHLHLGIALGFELRRPTGAIPRVQTESGWWQCSAVPAPTDADALSRHVTNGPAASSCSALELSLTRDVSPMVNQYIVSTSTQYRERIRLTPHEGPSQLAVTEDNMNAWAEQAAEELRLARQQVATVDVFIAAPIGYAVALGWRLNAIGGIRIFHPEGNAGPYRHVWTLPAS
jgi:SMODS-associated and fused to various effectors sensor domain/TIR domain